MAKSCSCGGSNENCCWCFGTGFISDAPRATNPRASVWLPRRRKSIASRMSKKLKPKANAICDRCSFTGTVAQVADHERDVHKIHDARVAEDRRTKAKDSAAELPPGGKVICPHCKFAIDTPNYYAHLRLMHSKERSDSSRQSIAKVPVKAAQQQPATATKPSRKDRRLGKPDTWKIQLEKAFTDLREHRQDATKDYAHSFRENGRFGSHPVHDDFGDDSKP